MAESSIIKEFLVNLGFKQDEASLKKFSQGIEQATKTVFALASAIEGTAITVAAGVARFASNLEQLYFSSMRTGTAATNLKAFDRAARDMGAGVGEAQASVEGLARFLRNNPGGEGALAAWFGVKVKDENGKQRDLVDVILDIGKAMQKMPTYNQQSLGGMIGLSENTIIALTNGEFAANYARIQKEFEKGGMDKAAQDAHKFMDSLRDLNDQLMLFGLQVYDALQNKFRISLDSITNWLKEHGPELAKQTAEMLGQIVDVAQKLILWGEKVAAKLEEWDKATNGWSTRILEMVAALRLLGATSIISGVLGLAAAFVRLGAGIATLGEGVAGRVLLRVLGIPGLIAGGAYELNKLLEKFAPGSLKAGNELGSAFYDRFHQKDNAVETLTNMGWSHPQAEGIVNVLNAESGLNPYETGDNGQAYGIGQWHPDRQARFKEFAGHDIKDSTGNRAQDLAEQLAFIRWEMHRYEKEAFEGMRHLNTEQESRAVYAAMYERPANASWETVRASPNLHINTDINVNGVKDDPAVLARFIALEQSRVNQDIVREFAPVVQ